MWLLNGGRSVEVEGAVCSGCEVIHSVVCWLETPRRAAPRSLTFASTAFTRFRYSARLSTSPPLLVPSSPSVSSTARRCCTFTFSFSLLRTTALTNYTSLNNQISPTRGSAPGKATRVELFESTATLGQLLPTTEILENKVTMWRLLSKKENPSILCCPSITYEPLNLLLELGRKTE